jgi:hypothetical protein
MCAASETVARNGRHCAYCGHAVADETPVIERFGEPFCSEPHAEEFAAGVSVARMLTAARTDSKGSACALSPAGRPGWRDRLKRAACWGAPLLLLLAIPLFWTGGWTATGGSLLSVLALLACPLSMYFMMRSMGSMQQQPRAPEAEHNKDSRHA